MTLLDRIADPARPAIDAGDVAVVVAHPDDETIGAGALLARLAGVTVVCVTDGAPRNGADAAAHGFGGWPAYARARAGELADALAVAGVPPEALVRLEVADQGAAERIADVARRLSALFRERGIRAVLTHAFEGGHPDHDAVAAAVHLAAGAAAVAEVLEMPLYHLGEDGMAVQRFCDGQDGAVLPLDAAEQAAKRRMLACHASQGGMLRSFSLEAERFRFAGRIDFSVPANNGRLLYAGHDWGLRPERWPALARAALAQFGGAAAA